MQRHGDARNGGLTRVLRAVAVGIRPHAVAHFNGRRLVQHFQIAQAVCLGKIFPLTTSLSVNSCAACLRTCGIVPLTDSPLKYLRIIIGGSRYGCETGSLCQTAQIQLWVCTAIQ